MQLVQFTASSGRHSVLERPFSEANGRSKTEWRPLDAVNCSWSMQSVELFCAYVCKKHK